MDDNNVNIDESTHSRIPTTFERTKYALFSLLLGVILINIIGFWMFPGPGIFGLYMFSQAHHSIYFLGAMTNVAVTTFLVLCIVFGWFQGQYFTDKLKAYISYWKFW